MTVPPDQDRRGPSAISPVPAKGRATAQEFAPINVGLAVRHTMRHFTRALNVHAERLNLTVAEFGLLRTLDAGQASSQAELAVAAAMDRPYVTALVKRMKTRGLLTAVADTVDRRRSRITMTSKGRQILATLSRQTEKLNATATAGIAPEDLETFLDVLARLSANLEAHAAASAVDEPNRRSFRDNSERRRPAGANRMG